MKNRFVKNCCDGLYNSIDVHFTGACDNKCAHCIDMRFSGIDLKKPNVGAICKTIIDNKEKYDDVLFLGGEPCLYLDELLECVKILRVETNLKLYVTTSVPKVCYDKREQFEDLILHLDGLNLSVQHYNESIADEIRKTKSKYNRQEFYNSLPCKDKIRINLNIVKPFLYTKSDILNCLYHYDKMGFNSIKISEIQHGKDQFVSFEKLFNINLLSPYYNGCQTYLDMPDILRYIKTPILLKRSCFMCEGTLKASIMDGVKTLYKAFTKPNNNYNVVYGNGEIKEGWI